MMKSRNMKISFILHKSLLLKIFDKYADTVKKGLVSQYDVESIKNIVEESRKEFEELLPEIPYIGGFRNPLNTFFLVSVMILAFYESLTKRGLTQEQVGEIVYRSTEMLMNSIPMKIGGKIFYSRIFYKWVESVLRKQANPYNFFLAMSGILKC